MIWAIVVVTSIIAFYTFMKWKEISVFPKEHKTPIVLFDGVCNLCDGFVNFCIDNDPEAKIKFASLQSDEGRAIIEKVEEAQRLKNGEQDGLISITKMATNLDSIILVADDEAYIYSDAVLRVFTYLKPPFSVLSAMIAVPLVIRTFGYKLVAKNRYLMFGQSESCRVPTKAIRSRFLSPLAKKKPQEAI